MMDALQLMPGLVLYETRRRYSYRTRFNSAEGQLWPGPYQFVFREKEFLGENRIWYNPDYEEKAWSRLPPQMERILQVVPWVRKSLVALDSHPLSDVPVRAIMLLQDGFATRHGSYRLLRCWSALEQLCVEPDAKNQLDEKVAKRAAFAESEPELSKWKLEHVARSGMTTYMPADRATICTKCASSCAS